MKHTISSAEREILRLLFQGSGELDLYDLHRKYKLGPGQIVLSLRRLSEMELVSWSAEGVVRLTPTSRQYILSNRRTLFCYTRKAWKVLPYSMSLEYEIEYAQPEGFLLGRGGKGLNRQALLKSEQWLRPAGRKKGPAS